MDVTQIIALMREVVRAEMGVNNGGGGGGDDTTTELMRLVRDTKEKAIFVVPTDDSSCRQFVERFTKKVSSLLPQNLTHLYPFNRMDTSNFIAAWNTEYTNLVHPPVATRGNTRLFEEDVHEADNIKDNLLSLNFAIANLLTAVDFVGKYISLYHLYELWQHLISQWFALIAYVRHSTDRQGARLQVMQEAKNFLQKPVTSSTDETRIIRWHIVLDETLKKSHFPGRGGQSRRGPRGQSTRRSSSNSSTKSQDKRDKDRDKPPSNTK